jgi:hypothetical protein
VIFFLTANFELIEDPISNLTLPFFSLPQAIYNIWNFRFFFWLSNSEKKIFAREKSKEKILCPKFLLIWISRDNLTLNKM